VITSVQDSQIECVTSAAIINSGGPQYEGGAGLLREQWIDTWLSFDQLIGIYDPDFATVYPVPQIPRDENIYFSDRMYGYFKAPLTGNYTFFASFDDSCQVILGTSDDPATGVSILSSSSYTAIRDQFTQLSSKSIDVQLEADTNYYLEVRHT
jgi:hypothetical protein